MSDIAPRPLPTVSEQWRYPGDVARCPDVRHRTRSALRAFTHAVDSVELVVAELFANACRHSSSGLGGTVTISVSALRIGFVVLTVADDGPLTDAATGRTRRPRICESDPLSTGCRGLQIVKQISDQWGIARTHGGGHAVWAAFAPPCHRPIAIHRI